MMHGTRDEFDYVECGACGTIQIADVPEDLAKYYPQDYYSFQTRQETVPTLLKSRLAARFAVNYALFKRNPLGKRLLKTRGWLRREPVLRWLMPVNLGISVRSKILDFGSGTGKHLLKMRYLGFQNLTGVDAFIESDIVYSPRVRILKRELTELEPSFDFVTLHHTFEHLPNPREILREIFRLLKRGKFALVRIPLAALAWREYGVNWVQLDPPRHLFLYTESSFRKLATEAGFAVEKVVYDSESFQFWGSEQYVRDIPLNDERSFSGDIAKSIFTLAQIAEFENQAARLNEQNEGDQACFYLRKI